MTPFLARRERFARVGSTNDVVRGWLADGTPEVCLAVADEQTTGRGRDGRRWVAPPGAALLASLGFRPSWLDPADAWRLAAIASLAMAEAGESVVRLPPGTIGLKWPNDLMVGTGGAYRKMAGVLGETEGLGTGDPRVVVGIGVNVDWPAVDFPPDLATSMTSLREAGGGRRVDAGGLLDAFVVRLEARVETLRTGTFDGVALGSPPDHDRANGAVGDAGRRRAGRRPRRRQRDRGARRRRSGNGDGPDRRAPRPRR